jgi:hypothetical protein
MGQCLCFAGITHQWELESGSPPPDGETLAQNLITFVTSGLEAPC